MHLSEQLDQYRRRVYHSGGRVTRTFGRDARCRAPPTRRCCVPGALRLYSAEAKERQMRKFIIDTDTASDDAVALVMALQHPDIEVATVTVVAGNVPLPQAVQNALYTVELCGKAVPVYAGLRQAAVARFGNGAGSARGRRHGRYRFALERTNAGGGSRG